jgi:hypothetical protein
LRQPEFDFTFPVTVVAASVAPSVLGIARTDTVPGACLGDFGPLPIAVAAIPRELASSPIAIALNTFRIVFLPFRSTRLP